MTFFGRRREQSEVAADHADLDRPEENRISRPSPSGAPGAESKDDDIFHGLFHRRGGSLSSVDSAKPVRQAKSECLSGNGTKEIPARQGSSSKASTAEKFTSKSSHSSNLSPPSAVVHGEPKQPTNIQDYLEYRLEQMCNSHSHHSNDTQASQKGHVLTKNEVKAMLSGAPHFLLERGKTGRWYPQVIFPWDSHHPPIQRMLDRKPLSHASFTLCTLHAHLPVPDDWAVKGGVPIQLQDWTRTEASKRATFDVGVFEIPNMLAKNGREPGTVGFRHFLELPIADDVRYAGSGQPCQAPNLQNVFKLPASQAFEVMDSYNRPYSQCQSGAVFDRKRLICDGPTAWKRIGVRDISLRALVQRMNYIRDLRLKILRNGSSITVLDMEEPRELHHVLHTQFLVPHPPASSVIPGYPYSLKSQIKTLATVLATPGAWIDFSLPEWRFRAGQILWESPPHADGDSIKLDARTQRESWVNSGMERKWLLVQLLLAAELLIRLDAFIRVDMLHDPHGGIITMQELQHFDRLREGKVNWDLIAVRRFLDNLQITCGSTSSESQPGDSQVPPSAEKVPGKSHRFALLESLTRHVSTTSEPELQSAWQCHISSIHVRQQLEGLYVFAENIGWPNTDALRSVFEQKLENHKDLFSPHEGNGVFQNLPESPISHPVAKEEMHSRSFSRRCVRLRSMSSQDQDPHATEPLGWISRSLLSGFVIPGEPISHLLIGTLLENDPDAIEQLGPTATLFGGFVFKGRSWWSKACIAGRVLASLEGSKTCMGWVGTDVVPQDATTCQNTPSGWFEIRVDKVPCGPHRPRIKQAGKMALESTPLGMGEITADAFTLPVDLPVLRQSHTVKFEALTVSATSYQERGITVCESAGISFLLQETPSTSPTRITFPFRYNVRFISAHECRPPLGFISQGQNHPDVGTQDPASNPTKTWSKYQRLPGHPLHRSFPYCCISLESLADGTAKLTAQDSGSSAEIFVVDARGSRAHESFARAWCASAGYHALIGRVGRTCVACCVREARAIDVSVVLRVGE